MEWQGFDSKQLSGRNRRLLYEWRELHDQLALRQDVDYTLLRRNTEGLPVEYLISYHIHSICGVKQVDTLADQTVLHPPVFADEFVMKISLPPGYPNIDAPVAFQFLCTDEQGIGLPHPWHPNIRYFGEFAGRVCINAMDTFASLAWSVERVALYLRYELYHAWPEPPYPEDMKVAEWVVKQGEPHKWVFFDQ